MEVMEKYMQITKLWAIYYLSHIIIEDFLLWQQLQLSTIFWILNLSMDLAQGVDCWLRLAGWRERANARWDRSCLKVHIDMIVNVK